MRRGSDTETRDTAGPRRGPTTGAVVGGRSRCAQRVQLRIVHRSRLTHRHSQAFSGCRGEISGDVLSPGLDCNYGGSPILSVDCPWKQSYSVGRMGILGLTSAERVSQGDGWTPNFIFSNDENPHFPLRVPKGTWNGYLKSGPAGKTSKRASAHSR
jgi:hypothetical protein